MKAPSDQQIGFIFLIGAMGFEANFYAVGGDEDAEFEFEARLVVFRIDVLSCGLIPITLCPQIDIPAIEPLRRGRRRTA